MREYGAVENQMDGMIRDIEELRAENEKLKAENKKLKNYRVLVPKPIDHWGDGLLFVPEGFKQLYNDEEVEEIAKERDELKVELRDKVDYIHEQYEVIKDYKHRAEVAERALKICLIDNRHCCECDMIDYKKCKGMDKDQKECAMLDIDDYIQRAEKELAEEGKDE